MSPPPQVTDEQIAAAQLRVILDSKLGRETPALVRRIAAATGTDETEPVPPEPLPPTAGTDAVVEKGSSPLLTALGVELDPALLTLALTHRSYAYEHGGLPPNERLEFLGDAMLGWVITDDLYREHPELPEGQLAKLRASVVNMRALAEVARGLGLGAHLRLGKGEEATGGRDKASILADAMEAVIGAVYLQHGTETARRLVHRLFDPLLAAAPRLGAGLDWKTSLQDLTAGANLGVPNYHIVEAGPDHDKEFTATVVVAGQEYATSAGSTKREAEQRAAETAYRVLAEQAESRPSGGPPP